MSSNIAEGRARARLETHRKDAWKVKRLIESRKVVEMWSGRRQSWTMPQRRREGGRISIDEEGDE